MQFFALKGPLGKGGASRMKKIAEDEEAYDSPQEESESWQPDFSVEDRIFLFLLQEGSAESRFSSSYENFKANSGSQIFPREVEMPLKKTFSPLQSSP